MIQVLAKHDLWQHESEKEIVVLAIAQLESMLKEEVYTNVNFVGEVIHLRNQLREVEPSGPIGLDFPARDP